MQKSAHFKMYIDAGIYFPQPRESWKTTPGFILGAGEQFTIFSHNIKHSISEFTPGSDIYRTVPLTVNPHKMRERRTCGG